MSRVLALGCLLASFALLGWAAMGTGPIDGRHVLAVILFGCGAALILDGDS